MKKKQTDYIRRYYHEDIYQSLAAEMLCLHQTIMESDLLSDSQKCENSKKLFNRDWGMVSVSQRASSFFTGGES